MSSIFDSLNSWNVKPFRRMGVTIDEEIYFARSLLKDVESSRLVLEIGGGNCLVSEIIRRSGKAREVVSVDTWNEEITINDVKSYIKGVELVRNLFPLPFRDESLDMVYSVLYFYNVKRENRRELAREVYRVLKKGGKFILVEPEIVRNMRKDFISAGFKEESYRSEQAVFFSKMVKG
ncbi:MAG: class I SAM-dependent methyltransferase [Candidatus Aramenus sp.]|nr:class I SAM-dependent methyltransferase [Candidatus Aramenus sp.]